MGDGPSVSFCPRHASVVHVDFCACAWRRAWCCIVYASGPYIQCSAALLGKVLAPMEIDRLVSVLCRRGLWLRSVGGRTFTTFLYPIVGVGMAWWSGINFSAVSLMRLMNPDVQLSVRMIGLWSWLSVTWPHIETYGWGSLGVLDGEWPEVCRCVAAKWPLVLFRLVELQASGYSENQRPGVHVPDQVEYLRYWRWYECWESSYELFWWVGVTMIHVRVALRS